MLRFHVLASGQLLRFVGNLAISCVFWVVGCSGAPDDGVDQLGAMVSTSNVRVNFQIATTATPNGYMADVGAAFGGRGNGWSYGWNIDNGANARERNSATSIDKRYDTLTHLQKPSNPNARWEIAVPNGAYSVHVVSGDPDHIDSVFKLDVEGMRIVDGTPTSTRHWIEGTATVTVSDGRLTVGNGAGAANNKICFIDIAAIPNSDAGVAEASAPDASGTSDGGMITPGDPGASDVLFDIRSDRNVHAISPLIYGTNGAPSIATTRQTLVRMGGNRWTAYNWENNASNAGADYFFQNDGYLSSSSVPGEAVRVAVANARANGAASLITVPIVDYVAADKNGGGDVRNSGSNYLSTRFRQNRAVKGSVFSTSPALSDAFVYQDEFVNWLKGAEPQAEVLFSLDNEPDLWFDTHAEVHPAKVGYDELVSRNTSYAKAIKAVSPTAKVTGFVSYGWYGYVTLQDAPDGAGKGEFVDYYLAQMKKAEAAAGKRLIDYLDLHWYPEATGGGVRITGTETSSAVIAAREQAPRSLWDPSYRETSWITSVIGEAIRLIPRIEDKIATNYPGTGLAFTEWNFGGGGHISGAIATADVLGIFGRDGVGLASFWGLHSDESFSYAAFRAYRNFDGSGGAFGDTSILATTSDVPSSSVYASIDAGDATRMVVMALNKGTTAKTAGIKVFHTSRYTKALVYTLTAASASLQPGAPVTAVATNAFRYVMPAQSISVFVLKP